jgi:imidazolonepropionase-like amidohydrolase
MFLKHMHRLRFHGIVLCIAIGFSFHTKAYPQSSRHLALVGGMLLTGYEVPPIHHAAILIEGDRIVQVGPASEVKIPADATVVDTSGRTMMPGLIETHAHLIVLGHGAYETFHGSTNMAGRKCWPASWKFPQSNC